MISIIVPVYNVKDYLSRCIDSLLDQTYDSYEIILVDDGSTDGSDIIAKWYQNKAPDKIVYFRKENGGQGSARNIGLKICRGDYICFVDSDDYVNPRYLQRLYESLQEVDADISMCGVERVFDSGRIVSYNITNDGSKIITDINGYIVKASFSVWNKLYKKEILEGVFFPEKIKFEDFAFLPRVIERAKKLVSIDDKLYYYYYRQGSTTIGVKINRDILTAQRILESDSFSYRNPFAIKIYFIRQVMGTLLWALVQQRGNKKEVMKIVDDALEKYPDLEKYIKTEYIGEQKSIWGKLLIKKHYNLASVYARLLEFLIFFAKKIIHR